MSDRDLWALLAEWIEQLDSEPSEFEDSAMAAWDRERAS